MTPGGGFGAPGWSPCRPIRIPVERVTAGQVQIASDGTVVALWTRGTVFSTATARNVKAARRPGQRFGSDRRSDTWVVLARGWRSTPRYRALALWGTRTLSVSPSISVRGSSVPRSAPCGRLPGHPLERGATRLALPRAVARAIAAWTRNGKVMASVHRQGLLSAADLPAAGAVRWGCCRQPARRCGCRLARAGTHARPSKPWWQWPADGRSPVIKHLAVRDFGARGLSTAVRPQFRFVLSEAAEVRILIARRAGGRFRRVTSLVRSTPAGDNHLTYGGRAGGLRPGRYRARINARDCGGRRSRSQAVPFVVSD